MIGPFPPGSWAAPKSTAATPLVNRDLAVARLTSYLADAGAKTDFTLSYPSDDPPAAAACARSSRKSKGLFKDAHRLVPSTSKGYLFATSWFACRTNIATTSPMSPSTTPTTGIPSLWSPCSTPRPPVAAAGTGLASCARHKPQRRRPALGQVLNELRLHRDPSKLVAKSLEAGRLFNESLPFIPLWQLDRHMVIHKSLKIFVERLR